MMYAYAGRMLRVDLSRRQIRTEPIDPKTARAYIGGRGLGTKIMHDEVDPRIDPLDPANKLILAGSWPSPREP